MKDATHFIEQYNTIGFYAKERREEGSPTEHFTELLPIDLLPMQLNNTADCKTIKTVAIFKIKLRQSCMTAFQ